METDTPKEYNVEKILAKRIRKKKVEYKIKWEGYPIDQSTWEPLHHLKNVQHIVKNYEQSIQEDPDVKLLGNKKSREKPEVKEKIVPVQSENKANIITNIDALTIQSVITVNRFDKELHGEVQYDDNGKIKKGWVSTQLLRKAVPNLLIDFYEKQIVFN